MTEFEKKVKEGNGKKPMTEKQRGYIARLLFNRAIDDSYKDYVRKALETDLNRLQASKIIDFLKSFIEFKKSFVDLGYGGSDVSGDSSDGMLAKDKLNARDVSSNINKDRLLDS